MEQATWFHRRAELCVVDGHEIHELSRPGEAETFHRQHTRSLRQRLDNHDTGHDRPSGKMSLKKTFIHGHGFDRADSLVDNEFLYAVDKQHRITVRQHRHDPTYVVIGEVTRHQD